MNRDDPLEALFAELRGPASTSEIAGEAEAVDAIASAVMKTRGTPMRLLSNQRLRVASFVAAGVIGFGGVAAAGPAVFDTVTGNNSPTLGEPVVEPEDAVVDTTITHEPTVTETTVTSIVTEPAGAELEPSTQDETETDGETEEPDSATTLVDDPDTTFDETTCAEGSHGKTVSSVAHETPSGPGKGKIVSEAAHSSCGKQTPPDGDTDDDEPDDESDEADDESDEPDDESDEADDESDDESESGNGNGNGGNGNGNGGSGNGNGGSGNGNGGSGNGNGGGGSGNGNGKGAKP